MRGVGLGYDTNEHVDQLQVAKVIRILNDYIYVVHMQRNNKSSTQFPWSVANCQLFSIIVSSVNFIPVDS
jgi:hypothetical protein